LLVGETNSVPGNVWLLDVSVHTPSVIGSTQGDRLDGHAMRLTSDGAHALFRSGAIDEVDLSNFEVIKQYAGPRGLQPDGVALADDDGYVAGAGVDDLSHGRVFVFKRGADTPVRTWDVGDFFSALARFRIGFSSDATLYMVSWDPVYENRPVQFRALSHATSQLTTLDLQTNTRTVTYGHGVRLTAQLGGWGSNHEVQFYATPLGGRQRLIGSDTIDRDGTASIVVRPKRQTIYTAAWTGDGSYAAAISTNRRVNVRVAMTGKLSNYSSKSGGYRIYHYTSTCPTSGKHCPVFTTAVSPNHAGKSALFRLQVATASGWRLIGSGKAKLSARSTARAIVPYTAAARGHRFRIAGWFGGDADHLGNHTHWARFKIT
jgi:WD40 repeat protein